CTIVGLLPVENRMRSVVVVLPASMWAMMPMFLQRSNGTVLGTTLDSFWAPNSASALGFQLLTQPLRHQPRANGSEPIAASLPSVMRERLIGLRHTVYIFF